MNILIINRHPHLGSKQEMLDNVDTLMELNNKWKETTFKLHFQLIRLIKAIVNHEKNKIVHRAYKEANT